MAPSLIRGAVAAIVARVAAADWSEALRAAALAGRPPPVVAPELPGGLAQSARAPVVPAQWSADLVYDGSFAGLRLENGAGAFHYDAEGKRYRASYYTTCSYFRPNVSKLQDQLTVALPSGNSSSNLTWGEGEDETCMPWFGSGTKYNDIFEFLRFATRGESVMMHGEPCRMWSLKIPSMMGLSLSACIAEDGYPRLLNQTYQSLQFSGFTRMRFSNIRPGSPGDAAFEMSQACSTSYPMPPCTDSSISTLDVYRIFGPEEPRELDNRNGGDVLGDLAFVCTQGSGEAYHSKLITHWRVNVSRNFGQYALCNFNGRENRCAGDPAQLLTVGRRSGQMQGVGTHLGQCSPNDDVGSQYSFPTGGKCAEGVGPGGGCSWGGAVAGRTVQAKCVMEERGLLDTCREEIGHAPFSRAAEIWERAFASDVPARGGCPDAPSGAEVLVV